MEPICQTPSQRRALAWLPPHLCCISCRASFWCYRTAIDVTWDRSYIISIMSNPAITRCSVGPSASEMLWPIEKWSKILGGGAMMTSYICCCITTTLSCCSCWSCWSCCQNIEWEAQPQWNEATGQRSRHICCPRLLPLLIDIFIIIGCFVLCFFLSGPSFASSPVLPSSYIALLMLSMAVNYRRFPLFLC